MIQDAIKNIKDKLKFEFPNFTVDDYPDDFDKYIFTAPEGCILVRYDAASYSAPQTTDIITQKKTMEFIVFMGLRYKKYNESYGILEKLESALTGLRIFTGKLYPKKNQFIKKIKSDYWWAYTFNLDVDSVQLQCMPNFDPLWTNLPQNA